MQINVLIDRATPQEWAALAGRFADHNLYQAWHFGECRATEMNAEVSRLVVMRDDEPIGLAQARIKQLPLLGAGVAHILFGPLWRRPGACARDLQDVLEALRAEYAGRRKLNVQIVPDLPESEASGEMRGALARAGFERDVEAEPYHTLRLDLQPPLDELRRRFAQKWRNGLNQAERNGVHVTEHTDERGIVVFETLYVEMKERKGFASGVSINLFRKLQAILPASEKLRVLLAWAAEQPVAGHVSSTLGDTCIYLLGASGESGRACKAAYLLQWHAVVRAKQAGARWYDLGGIDAAANPGTYHFKAGLGGEECRFVGLFGAGGGWASRRLTPLATRVYRVMKKTARV